MTHCLSILNDADSRNAVAIIKAARMYALSATTTQLNHDHLTQSDQLQATTMQIPF
jgi:hypothetical protein